MIVICYGFDAIRQQADGNWVESDGGGGLAAA
jgi:hypothetical protein